MSNKDCENNKSKELQRNSGSSDNPPQKDPKRVIVAGCVFLSLILVLWIAYGIISPLENVSTSDSLNNNKNTPVTAENKPNQSDKKQTSKADSENKPNQSDNKQLSKTDSKKIYIQDLCEMKEPELVKIAYDYYDKNIPIYTNFDDSPCSPLEVRDEFTFLAFQRIYTELLDVLLTKISKNKSICPDHYFEEKGRLQDWYYSYELLCVLKKHGYDLKTIGHHIHSAMYKKDFDTVKLFMEAGVGLDERDEFGRTPLHRAISDNNYEFAEFLIKNGANINLQDIDGKTPLDYALNMNHTYIIDLMKEYKKKTETNNIKK